MFMTGPIHHRVAKRWVRTAQIAMLVGAVGVVPVLLFGMPSAAPISVPQITPTQPQPDAGAQAKSVRLPGVDAAAVAARFELVSNTPKPKPVEDQSEGGATTPPAPPPALKFLGAIIEPATRAALLVMDGKQRMLWIGDKSGAIELVGVERDHITIKEHGIEKRLDLAPRSGPTVSSSIAAGNQPMPNAGQPPASGDASSETPDQREIRAREMLDRVRSRSEGRTPNH